MFIYRIEDAMDFDGPYGDRGVLYTLSNNYFTSYRHPTPGEDGIPNYSREHIFGFRNITQARKWFFSPSDCRSMQQKGLRLFVCFESDCKDVIHGKSQTVFKRPERFIHLDVGFLHDLSAKQINELALNQLNSLPRSTTSVDELLTGIRNVTESLRAIESRYGGTNSAVLPSDQKACII